MEDENVNRSIKNECSKIFQYRCPCKEEKDHLGVSELLPIQIDPSYQLPKVQKRFFLGHGINTNDPTIARNILLHRDHEALEELPHQYYHGKLGVYMVPPLFFGEVPEADHLSKYKKHLEKVRGDIAEQIMYFGLKEHYKTTGQDVLIIHSHKYLSKASKYEKDFIVFNLSIGKF